MPNWAQLKQIEFLTGSSEARFWNIISFDKSSLIMQWSVWLDSTWLRPYIQAFSWFQFHKQNIFNFTSISCRQYWLSTIHKNSKKNTLFSCHSILKTTDNIARKKSTWTKDSMCLYSKSLDDFLSTGDSEFTSRFNICNLHFEVIDQESKPPRTSAESFLSKVKLKTKSMCVFCCAIGKELDMLVLRVRFGPCLHHKGVINCKWESKLELTIQSCMKQGNLLCPDSIFGSRDSHALFYWMTHLKSLRVAYSIKREHDGCKCLFHFKIRLSKGVQGNFNLTNLQGKNEYSDYIQQLQHILTRV